MLISGTLYQGKGTLEPACFTSGPSSQPAEGPYRLKFRDRSGQQLKVVKFNAMEDLTLEGYRAFTFAMPLTAELKAAMVTLELWHLDELLACLQATDPSAPVVTRLLREPEARLLHPGVVRLTWDAATHPKIILKNHATGQDIGMATGGALDLETDALELEVILSDGLRSLTTRVGVQAPG